MNLRLVQFALGPGKRSEAEAMADKLLPQIRSQPGCERAEFFGDHETGDYGLIALWASPDAAEAAAAVIAPQLSAAMQETKATGVTRRLFEIYETKG